MLRIPRVRTPRQAVWRTRSAALLPIYLYFFQEAMVALIQRLSELNFKYASLILDKADAFFNTKQYDITMEVFLYGLGIALLANLFFRKGVLGMLSPRNLRPSRLIGLILSAISFDLILIVLFYLYFSGKLFAFNLPFEFTNNMHYGFLIATIWISLNKAKNTFKSMFYA